MKTLRPYQAKSIEVFKRDVSTFDASDLGTGKTLVGVERLRGIEPRGKAPRVLVVAPVNTHGQWAAAFREQFPSLSGSKFLRIIGTHKSDPESWAMLTSRKPGVYIIGWEAMRGAVGEDLRRDSNAKGVDKMTVAAAKAGIRMGKVPPWTRTGIWDLVIGDEIHRIGRRDSSNAVVLKLIKAVYKHGISATGAGNKIENLWSVLNWLWKDRYPAFWQWAEDFLEVEEKDIYRDGEKAATQKKIIGEKEAGVTWLDIPTKVRHRVADVRGQLPDVVERTVVVPMTERQREIYEDFAGACVAWLDNHAGEGGTMARKLIASPLSVEQRIRLRQAALGELVVTDDNPVEIGFVQEAENPKIDAVIEIIADLPAGEPVLIWTHSRKWALMAQARLKKAKLGEVRSWTGATTPKTREIYKSTFGTDFRILIAQIQAVAEGVDGLQRNCAAEIWASVMDGDVTANTQAEGRLHRDGQTRPVQRWHLHSEMSIDTDLAASLAARRSQLKRLYRDREKAAA